MCITLGAAIGAHGLRLVFEYFFTPYFMSKAKMQNDAELRRNYGNKATDNAFKGLYHLAVVVYGYAVIKDTVCHHKYIGGTQDDLNLLMPFIDVQDWDYPIFLYCLICHGYHFASLVRHLVYGDPDNSDYEKLLLHHIATNVMLITSNYGGNHRWGSVILWLHDAVDIFVSIARVGNSM